MRLTALGEAAGVEATPHVLRHTFGTRLLREAGADLVTVAALMGHSSVATATIYTQPSETDLVKAVEGL
jgi:site-specific recombinase XerD